MNKANRASIDFTLYWKSDFATHHDCFHAQKIDFWRDIFPTTIEQQLSQSEVGDLCRASVPTDELLEQSYNKSQIKTFASHYFDKQMGMQVTEPKLFRFYPTTMAWQGLNAYKGDYRPFRLIEMNDEKMTVDLNHPLARYEMELSAKITKELAPIEERGGVCSHIGELVTEKGPSMQVPHESGYTSLFDHYPFARMDENDDALFYSMPRMTHHLDATATAEITALYADLLVADSTVLDLMSSWISHLPEEMSFTHVVGLGMNEEELSANKRLDAYQQQDLNKSTQLPYADNTFDDAVCTVSIEYLTQPLAVMQEVARVVKSGGHFVVTFSERWFPPKAITLWTQLHPFERLQLVLEYFRQSECFADIHTFSKRGLPRPDDDQYIRETTLSDPVYAVWGTVK